MMKAWYESEINPLSALFVSNHLVQVKIRLGDLHQRFHMRLGLRIISHGFEILLASPLSLICNSNSIETLVD
ncbi:MAG: hypothetical protein QOJ41_1880 [Acidobacteriaceae bacterium]|jgi:hypothetical protein|nr:hypothetical protein [Acidobacteriaceae bacterium]